MNRSSVSDTSADGWASVVTYWMDGVHGYRYVTYSTSAEDYARQIAQDLSLTVKPLIEHHAERVNVSDCLEECFPDDPRQNSDYDWMDVCRVLERLPQIALAEYRESGSPAARTSHWYNQLFDVLNCIFPDDDGVWISLECRLNADPGEGFLSKLLEVEADRLKNHRHVSAKYHEWLGRLALLSRQDWKNPVPSANWQSLHQLVKEFNERYLDMNSLT